MLIEALFTVTPQRYRYFDNAFFCCAQIEASQSGPIGNQQRDSANSERRELHRMNAKLRCTATQPQQRLDTNKPHWHQKKSQKHRDGEVDVNGRCLVRRLCLPSLRIYFRCPLHCTMHSPTTPHLHHVKIPYDSLRIALVVLGLSIVALGTMCFPTGQTDAGVC